MHRNIFAWTAPGFEPAFVSINDRGNDGITLDARGPVGPDGKGGETIQITLPLRQLAELARALVCEVIPADLAP